MYRSPEYDPIDWLVRLRLVIDTEGVEWILARDNDGVPVLVDPEDAPYLTWGL